jgi:hypothetical protein
LAYYAPDNCGLCSSNATPGRKNGCSGDRAGKRHIGANLAIPFSPAIVRYKERHAERHKPEKPLQKSDSYKPVLDRRKTETIKQTLGWKMENIPGYVPQRPIKRMRNEIHDHASALDEAAKNQSTSRWLHDGNSYTMAGRILKPTH